MSERPQPVDLTPNRPGKKGKRIYRKLKAAHLSDEAIEKAVDLLKVHKSSTDAAESLSREIPGFSGSTVVDSALIYILLQMRKQPASAQSAMPYVVRKAV